MRTLALVLKISAPIFVVISAVHLTSAQAPTLRWAQSSRLKRSPIRSRARHRLLISELGIPPVLAIWLARAL